MSLVIKTHTNKFIINCNPAIEGRRLGSISLHPHLRKIRNAATFLRRLRLLWPVWLRIKRNSKRNGITNETWRIVVGVFRLVDFLSATHNPLKGIGYCEMLRRGGSFERAVGKLRSVDGSENITRLIMVQRIFSQPMVVLSASVGELTLSAE